MHKEQTPLGRYAPSLCHPSLPPVEKSWLRQCSNALMTHYTPLHRALMHKEQTPLGRFAPSLCHPSLPPVEKSWLRQCSVPPPPNALMTHYTPLHRALMHKEQTPLGRFAPSLCHPSLPPVEKSWLRQCSVPPPPPNALMTHYTPLHRALMHKEQTPLGRFAPSLCHPSLPPVEKSWLRQCSVPPPPQCVDDPLYATAQSLRAHSTHKAVYTQSRECTRSYTADRRTRTLSILV